MDKDNKIKVIANYLPQYHRIPENDKWWGEGFTDWTAARTAKPLYQGHRQPRIPANNYYYDLTDINAIKWQADLAKKNGIYGFGIYHYWFNSEMQLLEKPAELLLKNQNINIHYLFIWDNVSWKRSWKKMRFSNEWSPRYDSIHIDKKRDDTADNGILAEIVYGTEIDWKKHFDYISQFFYDDRYIKIDNKPVFVVFNPNNNAELLKRMMKYWNVLAREKGFDGVVVIGRNSVKHNQFCDYEVNYEPGQSLFSPEELFLKIYIKAVTKWNKVRGKLNIYDYDKVWKRILKRAILEKNRKIFYSGFVDFDDTPRRGENARIIRGATPEKFGKYFLRLLQISKNYGKEFVFLTAWNEWGEGAYLEPDMKYGHEYLETVKRAIEKINGDKI